MSSIDIARTCACASVSGQERALVRPALFVLLAATASPTLEPERLRLRQQLLCGRRAGGHRELEGPLLRFARFLELHHGRQAACVAVVMAISGRIFGFSSWSMLVPQRSKASPQWRSSTPREAVVWRGSRSRSGCAAR